MTYDLWWAAAGAQLWPGRAAVLAQASSGPTLLPGGSGLGYWLFEAPTTPIVLVLLVGAVTFGVMTKRGSRGVGLIALGVAVAAAAAIFIAARLVTTEREVLEDRTTQVVDAAASGDPIKLHPLLRADVTLSPFNWMEREDILARVGAEMREQYALRSWAITDIRVAIDGPNAARTQVHVRATPANFVYQAPVGSWWLLTWHKEANTGNWVVRLIEWQQVDGFDVHTLRP